METNEQIVTRFLAGETVEEIAIANKCSQDVIAVILEKNTAAIPVNVINSTASTGLTDDELRATPVPVSGPITDAELRASSVPVLATATLVSVASAISGQATVTTAGTSVQGGNVPLTNGVYIKALGANTGKMYIGYATGDNRTGYELSADQVVIVQVANLNQLWFDASVNGEKICWLKA